MILRPIALNPQRMYLNNGIESIVKIELKVKTNAFNQSIVMILVKMVLFISLNRYGNASNTKDVFEIIMAA